MDYHEGKASQVVHRVPVTSLTKTSDIEKIRDPLIKSALLKLTDQKSGKEFEEAVLSWSQSSDVKSVRILETVSVIAIHDKNGKPYKGYKGDGNACMEIYEEPATGKWKSEIVSRFDANQKSVPAW